MRAIGVFDSGLGGLTVLRAIREQLPAESVIYLGDTARVPYGTRSPQTILRYARSCGAKLRSFDIKMLVVACNTVSAVALDMLRIELDVPVLGVIRPGAAAGMAVARGNRIGVLATYGTVASGAYTREIGAMDSRAEVFAQPAPLLVPLVEEGWVDGEVPRLAVRRYLEPLVRLGIDSLILGCTHYPLLGSLITSQLAELAGRAVPVVDSASAAASELGSFLTERGLARPLSDATGILRILVTDLPGRFEEVAGRFLGSTLAAATVEQMDL